MSETDAVLPLQWLVTVLAVTGFGLAALGSVRVYRDTTRRLASMERERALRMATLATLHREREAADVGPEAERAAAKAAASEKWRRTIEEAGLEVWDYNAVNEGREFLAERIIRESAFGSRGDLALVAIGLIVGLVATLLDVWLL